MKFLVRVVLVVVLIVGFAVGTKALPLSCTVGLAGAAVSIQADGPGAGQVCGLFEGAVTDGGTWYRYQGSAEAAGAVICQYAAFQWVTVTVRDQGVLNLYGTSVCQQRPGGSG